MNPFDLSHHTGLLCEVSLWRCFLLLIFYNSVAPLSQNEQLLCQWYWDLKMVYTDEGCVRIQPDAILNTITNLPNGPSIFRDYRCLVL